MTNAMNNSLPVGASEAGMPELLTTTEIAERLGISTRDIVEAVEKSGIPYTTVPNNGPGQPRKLYSIKAIEYFFKTEKVLGKVEKALYGNEEAKKIVQADATMNSLQSLDAIHKAKLAFDLMASVNAELEAKVENLTGINENQKLCIEDQRFVNRKLEHEKTFFENETFLLRESLNNIALKGDEYLCLEDIISKFKADTGKQINRLGKNRMRKYLVDNKFYTKNGISPKDKAHYKYSYKEAYKEAATWLKEAK